MKLYPLAVVGQSYSIPEFGEGGNTIITGSTVGQISDAGKKFQIIIITVFDHSGHDSMVPHVNYRLAVKEILGDYAAGTKHANCLRDKIMNCSAFNAGNHVPIFCAGSIY